MDNQTIAQRLLEYADFLDAGEVNVYRIRAYRKAAETVMGLDRPVKDVLAAKGRAGLEELPGIGSHLSYTLEELVRRGELRTLNGEGQVDPDQMLTSLPGIGARLARRIRQRLQISTLADLEHAAHDGRLTQLGIGPKRLRGIREALAGRLGRYRYVPPVRGEPTVAELLAVDEQYRAQAALMKLPTIAPRRFNPTNDPWLPVYQTQRAGWRFRAIFSNTALAHRLGQTHDWVVIYFHDGITAGQRTVVTETRGDLRGRRVVRGREQECRDHCGLATPSLSLS
jgi:hypothetical protein